MRIILLGAPGSGKGTLVRPLATRFNLHALSTGDMLRRVAREGSEMGRKVDGLLEQGKFVPDELVVGVLQNFLGKLGGEKGYVLDGFPRNVPQAEFLEHCARPDCVLLLQVADDVLTERALGRLICLHCSRSYHRKFSPPQREGVCDDCGQQLSRRSDDTPEVVLQRLQRYHRSTEPLIDFYRARNALITVQGVGTPQEVEQRAGQAVSERHR